MPFKLMPSPRRPVRPASRLATVITLVLAAMQAQAGGSIDAMLDKAAALGLASHPGWLALLHYKPAAITRAVSSQVDDPAFFLSPEGSWDAEAELRATLAAMAAPASGDDDARCRFPARREWISRQLGIMDDDHDCSRLRQWLDGIAAERLVLVFPTMYLNNPGSMFGHTFLRFDDAGGNVLLSHALNYAAVTLQDDDPVTYVMKGLFGGYTGRFALRRYFETVQEYSHIENRDIYEYTLDLEPDEIRQLLRHVWELREVRFDYFFLRENCSYRLLSLLEVARPSAPLTAGSRFPLYAVPVDTVRALHGAGMVVARAYRPSLYSQVDNAMRRLPRDLADEVIGLADGTLPAADYRAGSAEETAGVLETAYNLQEFRGEPGGTAARAALLARSRVGVTPDAAAYRENPPESGHASARLHAGGGSRNDAGYIALGIRPGFHDLSDAPRGFAPGAEINVLETQAQYFTAQETLLLDRLRFMNVVSLSPVRSWHHPVSWLLDIKLERTYLDSHNSTVPFVLRGGAGFGAEVGAVTLYGLLVADAQYSKKYDGNYSVLAGVQLGLIANAGFAQLRMEAGSDNAVAGMDRDREYADAELQVNLRDSLALRAGCTLKRYDRFDDRNVFVRVQWYF